MGKFKVGDTVQLNHRTPEFIPLRRFRPRIIIFINYDPQKQCNFYTLGSNGRGACANEPATFGYGCYPFQVLSTGTLASNESHGETQDKKGLPATVAYSNT